MDLKSTPLSFCVDEDIIKRKFGSNHERKKSQPVIIASFKLANVKYFLEINTERQSNLNRDNPFNEIMSYIWGETESQGNMTDFLTGHTFKHQNDWSINLE